MWKSVIGISAATLLIGSAAFAQPKEKTNVAKARSPASIECSKQADQKGLHGKARKKFRSKCIRDMKKKG